MNNPRPIPWDEALKLNGKPGYTPKDALDDREKALAKLAAARSPVKRVWVALAREDRSCDRHGPYTSTQEQLTPPTPLNPPFWTQCPKCEAEIEAEQNANSASSVEMRKTIERMRLLGAGMPERMFDADFHNWQHRIPAMDRVWRQVFDYAQNLQEAIEHSRCAVFHGSHGSGKTHLACAVLRRLLLKLGGTGIYTTQLRFLSRLRATMNRDADETDDKVYNHLVSADLLVLDEIGSTNGDSSSWERRAIFRLLDERYQHKCKPTIILSNLSLGELASEVSPAGLDRMKENGGLKCFFNWESQRK